MTKAAICRNLRLSNERSRYRAYCWLDAPKRRLWACRKRSRADIVLLNTCAVRDKAEQRIFGRLGWLKTLKKREKPDLVLGVAGCMAERMRSDIHERAPFVDLVIGPDAYRRLPDAVDSAFADEDSDFQAMFVWTSARRIPDVQIDRVPGVSGWINASVVAISFAHFALCLLVARAIPFSRRDCSAS